MIAHWFTLIIYQPFLNLLVTIYWGLQQIPVFPHKDMGVAVIIFTIAFRILWIPISMASKRSEQDRRNLEERVKELNESLAHDPVSLRTETKQLFREKPWMMAAATFDMVLQVCIAFMLWRIFARGLEGADLHLLYKFSPHPPIPYDLTFWKLYDLSKPNMTLNLIQSLMILAVEALNLWTTPYKITRADMIRLLIFLPGVSFLIFMFLPAGKKLFIITTLLFSFIFNLVRQLHYLINKKFIVPTPSTLVPAAPTPIMPTTPSPTPVPPQS
jgi:membrane protein insertase Oxa1/YidC/SpoIIIJ